MYIIKFYETLISNQRTLYFSGGGVALYICDEIISRKIAISISDMYIYSQTLLHLNENVTLTPQKCRAETDAGMRVLAGSRADRQRTRQVLKLTRPLLVRRKLQTNPISGTDMLRKIGARPIGGAQTASKMHNTRGNCGSSCQRVRPICV